MKRFSFMALAAAGLLFGACSSDNDEVVTDGEQEIAANGEGFVGISIQMPDVNTPTRANDDVNNGLATEFEVKNGYVYFFKGTDEATATYLQRSDLTSSFTNDDKGANEKPSTYVTSTSTSVAKINKLTLGTSEKLFAYVILNKPNTITDPAANAEFGTWSKTAFNAATIGGSLKGAIVETGMLMMNAPISETAGGSQASTGKIITAIQLDATKIAKTEAAAKEAPAGCIYVERAAAKVTLKSGESLGTEYEYDGTNKVKFEVAGWQVINTEPTYYNARQSSKESWWGYATEQTGVNANTQYRFVSLQRFSPTLPSGATHLVAYRTYFAEDPQFDKDAPVLENTIANNTSEDDWLKVSGGVAYVPENTFDVERQNSKNTTQVALKVKFNEGKDFYTISNDAAIYTDDSDIDTKINNAITARVQAAYDVDNWSRAAAKELADKYTTAAGKAIEVTATITATVPTNVSASAGVQAYTVSCAFSAKEKDGGADYTTGVNGFSDLKSETQTAWENATTGVKAAAEKLYTVTLYKGGYSYYNVRIQHFGDKETPWEKNGTYTKQPGEKIEEIYGAGTSEEEKTLRNRRFLGRYGIVRDNWYQLSIDAVKGFGAATPTDVKADGTPDDTIDEEYYVAAHVHILPWVLRDQSITLK